MKTNVCTEKKSVPFAYDICFFSIAAILVALISDHYILNPFVLPILALSYFHRTKTFVFTQIFLLATSFLVNINYGLEMMIVVSCYTFLQVTASFLFAAKEHRVYIPLVFTHLVLMGFALIISFSFDTFVNVFLLFAFSFGIYVGFYQVSLAFKDERIALESRYKVIVLALLPFLFAGLSNIFFLIARILQMMILKTVRFAEAVTAILFTSAIMLWIQQVEAKMILTFIGPFLFTTLLAEKKPSSFLYVLFYILFEAALYPLFYQDIFFYQGLIAFFFVHVLSDDVYEFFRNFFAREDHLSTLHHRTIASQQQQEIGWIVDYLTLVLDPRLEQHASSLEKAMVQLDRDLCFHCAKRKECVLAEKKQKGISSRLNKEDKTVIIDQCIFPYKLIRRMQMVKDLYQSEEAYYQTLEKNKNLYQQEIKTIYQPLKAIKSYTPQEEAFYLQSFLQKKGFKIEQLTVQKQQVEIIIHDKKKRFKQPLCDALQEAKDVAFTFVSEATSFSYGTMSYVFSSRPLYRADFAFYTQAFADQNGDAMYVDEQENHTYFYLSDGMGHGQASHSISNYLLEALKAYGKIEKNKEQQIRHMNQLLKHKSTAEIYATLDYIAMDRTTLQLTMLKAGSYPSYLYRGNELTEWKAEMPPLGIVEDIGIEFFTFKAKVDDIYIFATDGFLHELTPVLKDVLPAVKTLSSTAIKEALVTRLKKEECMEDDQTMIVMKINPL